MDRRRSRLLHSPARRRSLATRWLAPSVHASADCRVGAEDRPQRTGSDRCHGHAPAETGFCRQSCSQGYSWISGSGKSRLRSMVAGAPEIARTACGRLWGIVLPRESGRAAGRNQTAPLPQDVSQRRGRQSAQERSPSAPPHAQVVRPCGDLAESSKPSQLRPAAGRAPAETTPKPVQATKRRAAAPSPAACRS